jgi:hypothetical protein
MLIPCNANLSKNLADKQQLCRPPLTGACDDHALIKQTTCQTSHSLWEAYDELRPRS